MYRFKTLLSHVQLVPLRLGIAFEEDAEGREIVVTEVLPGSNAEKVGGRGLQPFTLSPALRLN